MAIQWKEEATSRGFATPKEMLEEWYIRQRMPVADMATLVGAWSPTTIFRVLERFGIPRRRRGRPSEGRE
jgi:hypothetical protein